jgi:cytochrome c peroxidase
MLSRLFRSRPARAVAASLATVALVAASIVSDVQRGAIRTAQAAATERQAPWRWDLPPGVPEPVVPSNNPMSPVKFELGRRLFYEKQLSGNGVLACAGCHLQARAFADNLPRAVGSTGDIHPRAAMSLANIAYASVLTWADPNETRLEKQLLTPVFGTKPIEMGLSGKEAQLFATLRGDSTYQRLFRESFPGQTDAISIDNIAKAIATFERGLISFNSPYDRSKYRGEVNALSAAARRGEQLFNSDRLGCARCHSGITFSASVNFRGKASPTIEFRNNGLYNVGPLGAYPADNPGVAGVTKRPADNGAFKAPSLRNIAVSAPYMHDGSLATLDDVIAHYARGGRLTATGPNAGDGRLNPNKSPLIRGFRITPAEQRDLVAFLNALTDSSFLRDPRFADPSAEPRSDR